MKHKLNLKIRNIGAILVANIVCLRTIKDDDSSHYELPANENPQPPMGGSTEKTINEPLITMAHGEDVSSYRR